MADDGVNEVDGPDGSRRTSKRPGSGEIAVFITAAASVVLVVLTALGR